MNHQLIINGRSMQTWLLTVVSLLLSTTVRSVAGVQDRHTEPPPPPGYVDGSEFSKLADENDTLVEINIRSPLLGILAKATSGGDKQTARLLSQIKSVSAVVAGIDSEQDKNKAADSIASMSHRLEQEGWEHIARIREKGSHVNVLILHDDEVIQGIVVMVIEREDDEQQLVFANIAGEMDLSMMGALGSGLKIPGVDQLSKVNWSKAKHSEKNK